MKLFDYKKYKDVVVHHEDSTQEVVKEAYDFNYAKIIGHVCLGILILILFFGSFTIVPSGNRGVIVTMGSVGDSILNEGVHFKLPIIQKIIKMDVMTAKEEREASAASKDLQIVTAQVAINYHLDPSYVNIVYQKLRKNYSERVIMPAIEEFIKKSTAQFTAEELITKRTEVKDALRNSITENLANNHILVDDIFITNFEFSTEFDSAIEAKVTAEQRALEQKNKLEQIKYEAEQKVTTAQAEAEAIRIKAQAVTQQGGKDYVQLQAIEKWDGKLPAQMIPGGTVPFLDLSK